MPKRTEEEIVIQAGIKVILGGREYSIRPLVIRESREWRAKVVKFLTPLPQYAAATSDNPAQFIEALQALMVTMPDEVIDLFFDYARELDREEIEKVATDTEVAKAFEQVVEQAFPLSQSVVVSTGAIAPKMQSR